MIPLGAMGLSCAKLLNGLVEGVSCNHIRRCGSCVSSVWCDFELVGGSIFFYKGQDGEYVWGGFSKLCLKVDMDFFHYLCRVSSNGVVFFDYLVCRCGEDLVCGVRPL
jgi:hypothetical protein